MRTVDGRGVEDMGTVAKLKTATQPPKPDPSAVSIETKLVQHLLGTLVSNAQALTGEFRAAQLRAYGLMQSGGEVEAIGVALATLAGMTGEKLSEQGLAVVARANAKSGAVH